MSREEIDVRLSSLADVLEICKSEIASPKIKEAIKAVVPTFVDPEEINKTASKSNEMAAANS